MNSLKYYNHQSSEVICGLHYAKLGDVASTVSETTECLAQNSFAFYTVVVAAWLHLIDRS